MKKFLSILLSIIIAGGAFGLYSSYAADEVALNKDSVYIDGYPDKTFLPEKKMTRAEAAKVTAVACGYSAIIDTSDIKTQFSDISEDEWYTPYVKYLEKYDMIGFFGKEFKPNAEITRAEFVKLISSVVPKKTGNPYFSDVSSSHPYYSEIMKAAKAEIVKGNPDGTFNPDGTLKRAEIVTMLNRLLERNVIESRISKIEKFTDIDDHWAKTAILAASTKASTNNMAVWYAGDVYAANSPVDGMELEYPTTEAVMELAADESAAAAESAIEDYAEKRRQEIRETPTSVKVSGTSYYVSNDGNDSNDGLTPETAWKTLNKVSNAKLKPGDGVFLRRGDIFRGTISVVYEDITYSAYGEGPKPRIYSSKRNYSESEFWDETDTPNVYVSKEAFDSDVGLIVFNEGEAWSIKKVEGINGTNVVSDLEMYHSTKDKKLYLYSTSDPDTRFTSTEIGENDILIHSARNGGGSGTTVDNLCLMYSGGYGVEFNYGVSDITVQNCEIGWIGGSLQPTNNRVVRYGNGVEIYGSCYGFVVDNCYIYQIYDAGITHQYFGTATESTKGQMKDIKYTNNLIEYCTWAIEVSNTIDARYGYMKDVEISGNLLLHSGDGWGQQRPNNNPVCLMHRAGATQINNSSNYYIYDNVIFTKNSAATLIESGAESNADMPRWIGNIFMGVKNNSFGICGVLADYKRLSYTSFAMNKTIGFEDNTFFYLDK